jgi:TP901 family phage tail tape measure protein
MAMDEREVGAIKIGLKLDTTEASKSVTDINSKIKAIRSEFNHASDGTKKYAQSVEGLTKKNEGLQRELTLQEEKLKELRKQHEAAANAEKVNEKQVEKLAAQYNNTQGAINRLNRMIETNTQKIKQQGSEFTQLQNKAQVAIVGIDGKIQTLNSRFKASVAGVRDFGRSTDDMRQKSDHLTQVLNLQGQKTEELRKAYERLKQEKGEDNKETQQSERAYHEATAAYKEAERELNDLNHTLDQQNSKWGRIGAGLNESSNKFTDFGQKAQAAGSSVATSFGAATIAVGGGLAYASKKSMDFEAQLSSIKALTGASGQEMDKMSALAIKMGSQTKYSSLEAAQGIEELLKAGLTPAQVQAGGLEQALNLATAGGLDLAKAAEIMSTGLNTFKKDGMSAADASNILAGSANASATSVEELQYGLAAVGTVADGTGFSFQDTAAALGVFANNGLKGSDAGTSLKTMLANLQPSTKAQTAAMMDLGLMTKDGSNAFFDAQGNVKSMGEVAGLLQNSMKDLTNEQRQATLQTLFGSDAIRAGNILYKEGEDGIKKFKSAMGNVTAEEVASEKMKNLKGDIEQLKGSFETLAINFGKAIEPIVKVGVDGLQKVVDWFNNLNPEMQKTIAISAAVGVGLLAIVTAGAALLSVVGTASIGIGALTGGLATLAGGAAVAGTAAAGGAAGVGLLGGALTILTGPVGLAIAAIAGIAVAAYAMDKALDKPIVKSDIFGDKVSKGTKKAVGAYMDLENKSTQTLDKMYFNQEVMTDAHVAKSEAQFKAMGDKIKGAIDKRYTDQINQSKKYFADSSALTEKEENAIIQKLKSKQNQKKKDVDSYEKQIHKIEKGAADERRSLNDEEYRKIDAIKKKMRESAVRNLSQSEKDQKIILGRLKNESVKLSTEQTSKVLQQSAKARDGSIKDANTTYNKKVKWIREQRDVLGTMSKEEADKLLKEAKRQKDGSIKDANEMYRKVVENAKKQSKGHADEIDWETGKIKTGWQKMNDAVKKSVDWLNKIFGVGSSKTAKTPNVHSVGDNATGKKVNAGGRYTGTPNGFHEGGPAFVGEEGPELLHDSRGLRVVGMNGPELMPHLEKGASVLPTRHTNQVLRQYGFAGKIPMYATGVGDYFDDILKGPKALWNKAAGMFNIKDSLIPDWANKITGSPLKFIGGLAEKKIKSLIDDWGFGGSAPNIKGGAAAWRPMILKAAAAMKESVTAAQVNGIIAQIQRESGGNQRIVQSSAVRDINTRNGNPARGLLQYIPQTFAAYALKSNRNIYSGYDQLLAFFNNTSWRKNLPYGKRGWGPTGKRKYANGGIIQNHQVAEMGEEGPEMMIPLVGKRRKRALELWLETGQMLGALGMDAQGNSSPTNHSTQISNNSNTTNNYELHFNLPEGAAQQMGDPASFAKTVKKELELLNKMENRYKGVVVQ